MADVDWGSISQKLEECARSQKFAVEHDAEISAKVMHNAEIAGGLCVQCINDAISSSGLSGGAIAAVGDVQHTGPEDAGGYGEKKIVKVQISVSRQFRPSVQPSVYGGVNDMAALFNNGYSAGGSISGLWHGNYIHTKQYRPATHFFENGLDNFNSTHGSTYFAEAIDTSGRFY